MRKIHYLFSFPKDPQVASRVIKWRLKTDYSHVCMAVEVPELNTYRVYQASHGWVNTVSLDSFTKKNHIIKSCSIVSENSFFLKALGWMERQTGKRYGIWTALAMTFELGRKLRIGDDDDAKFVCSELAYQCYLRQTNRKTNLNPDYVDPYDFEELLRLDGHTVRKGMIIPL